MTRRLSDLERWTHDKRPRKYTAADWWLIVIVAFVLIPWVVWECMDAVGRMP
jgi:hypothetical protein